MAGLKEFKIYEFDRDYRTITEVMTRKFTSKEAADVYCKEISWTGYDYYAEKEK